jgi:ribA/ribD-fused uncharacterized protein
MDYPPIPADGRVLFFRRDRPDFGFLSHFYPSPILLDGEEWPTVEHYYQFHKSLDPQYRQAIRDAATPGEAKQLSAYPDPRRKAAARSWFLANGQLPRADWMAVKRDIMRRADRAKYDQHPDLAERLLATDEAEIVEDSPYDDFWGVGRDATGENWAGRILMEVRAALRAER